MSEEDLLSAVTAGTRARPGLCKLLGITWYHTRDSRGSMPGFPDLVLIGSNGCGVLFRELKTSVGKLTEEQWEWGNRLLLAGADWAVWRPGDLADRILAELHAIR